MIDLTITKIRGLAFWQNWQQKVVEAGEMFAGNQIFVEQQSQTYEEFEETALAVAGQSMVFDWDGATRDKAHGARVVTTAALGPVTRQWLDSNVEIDFLMRHGVERPRVLDIGAGYGRLAVSYAPLCEEYVCTDAVPVSQAVCAHYLSLYAPYVDVYSPEELLSPRSEFMLPDLAINIHSWNESSVASVEAWLDLLDRLECKRLFTVSHGQLANDSAYLCHEPGKPCFRPLLESRYDLVAEESIGMSSHPYALWKRK